MTPRIYGEIAVKILLVHLVQVFERHNRGIKTINSLRLSPVVIS